MQKSQVDILKIKKNVQLDSGRVVIEKRSNVLKGAGGDQKHRFLYVAICGCNVTPCDINKKVFLAELRISNRYVSRA